jgi:hypothetical protein
MLTFTLDEIVFTGFRELGRKPKRKERHKRSVHAAINYHKVRQDISQAFHLGNSLNFSEQGFSGDAFEQVADTTRLFLNVWADAYLTEYQTFKERIEQHEEVRNYQKVMKGAAAGVGLGVTVGVGIDVLCMGMEGTSVGWEIAARALPALLEAEEIARPFAKKGKQYVQYLAGKADNPEQFTSTEVWALTQLAGPFLGMGMLVAGEYTRWNDNPLYRALAVFTINTGNNVIGGVSAYGHFVQEQREQREFQYITGNGNPRRVQYLKDFKEDLRVASCMFWADSFQRTNMEVASLWYVTEALLRSHSIAAENTSFNGFGGKTLAAVESGLLSCDTVVAAGLAIAIETKKLEKSVRQLTTKKYLDSLYAQVLA